LRERGTPSKTFNLPKAAAPLGGFMGEHSSDDSPEVSGRGFLVNGTLFGVGAHSLSQELHKLQLISEMSS